MERDESESSVSWSPVQEAGTVDQACQGTGLAQKVLGCCMRFPAQLEGGPHAGYGRLQRLLVVPHLRRWRRQAMQCVEGSAQGLYSLSQWSETKSYLLVRGQSYANFCKKPDRATQRSSLGEIAVSS